MYTKKTDRPVFAVDHMGNRISRADLPPKDTVRWVAGRKAIVVAAVRGGLLSLEEACAMYGLSEEELKSWILSMHRHGIDALLTTKIQSYRKA